MNSSNNNNNNTKKLMNLGFTEKHAKKAIAISKKKPLSKNNAAKVITAASKVSLAKRDQKLINFQRDLIASFPNNKNENRNFYGKLIDKIIPIGKQMIKAITRNGEPTLNSFKTVMAEHIGQCHINKTNMLSRPYLKFLIESIYAASNKYSKLNNKDKRVYMTRVQTNLEGFPCVDNLVEALTSSFYDPLMVWTGRRPTILLTIPRTEGSNDEYLAIMARAIGSYLSSEPRLKNNVNKRSTINQMKALQPENRLNRFWKLTRQKNLQVNINENPTFIPVKNYNINGRIFKNSGYKAANYLVNLN